MSSLRKKSGLVIIGDEILSGRTLDTNSNFLSKNLSEKGIDVKEVAVVQDKEFEIINKVKEFSNKYDIVFTTGGIGPTHDDITTSSISKAFNLKYKINTEAQMLLKKHYSLPGELTQARLKMAFIPEGATLIYNPISVAPGFKVKNVCVFPGVPQIMQGMFNNFIDTLTTTTKMPQISVTTTLSEGIIGEYVANIQIKYSNVKIGSYPYFKNGDFGVTLVLKSEDRKLLDYVSSEIFEYLKKLDGKPKYL